VKIESTAWSGEGAFTQQLLDALERVPGLALVRVEDAPASRSEADYNFISNEIYVAFATVTRHEPVRRFGVIPGTKVVSEKALDVAGLGSALGALPGIGEPDYADEGMLQYLRTERIVPPYQTRGYKLVELVRIYEAGSARRDEPR
jgi:hypothetical protein